MSGIALDVQWSHCHPDKFVTWGTDICLYEVVPNKGQQRSLNVKISDSWCATLVSTNSNLHYIKCVDIYPHPEPDILLAVGQANGKVTLSTFGPTVFDSRGLTGKELVPRHVRQCNSVVWNPIDNNLLATALDKSRTDHSLLVWDLSRCHSHQVSATDGMVRPSAELGLSETAHSAAWLQQRNIILGMNNKHIKVFDIRDSNKSVNSTITKAVFGVCIDPNVENQLASFIENQIFIWDLRYFEKPVLTLNQSKHISKILWCPTRHNLLGSLMKDSNIICLYDIQHTVVGSDEVEPTALERNVLPCSVSNVKSFSWHPTHENRLLAIDTGGAVNDYVVSERITLNWSVRSDIFWTHSGKILKLVNEKFPLYRQLNDISVKMRKRALHDYGLKTELEVNGSLADDDNLKKLWKWLALSHSLVESGVIRGVSSKYPGVRNVLKLDSLQVNSNNKSEMVSILWSDFGSINHLSAAKIFRSEERDMALQLCSWRFDSQSLVAFLDRLEAEGSYARAAAIAVFNLKLRLAIDILNRGALQLKDPKLSIIAMALSGFTDERNSMWRELCNSSLSQLSDPYLRATFGFLTGESDSYDKVLSETGILVADQVAFACTFLSDLKLSEYLRQLTSRLTEQGALSGFLLTGISTEVIQLMQKYLDITGDVQSVSILAIRTFPPELLEADLVKIWIESYRELLDLWKLWNQRAQFDITLRVCTVSQPPPQQVFVTCSFCSKSISAQMQGHNKNRGPYARLGATAQKLKMSACPQCRKPLPRCAICLMHMGTASGTCSSSTDKLTDFQSWFTWCQTCRHGGHAGHMSQWFREHLECPVSGCTCRCLSLDAASTATSLQSLKV